MQNQKLQKEWVRGWSVDGIVSNAVSQGMGFQSGGICFEDLKYNKKILIKELKERIKEQ